METLGGSDTEVASLAQLDDPEFFGHWAALRLRIAHAGKSVPHEMKREYAMATAEYRRRVNQGG